MNLIQKNKLAILLNKVLKQTGKLTGDNEIVFICPFHKAINNVSRKKFGISFDGEYNCFACGESGKSFRSLFKKLKVSSVLYKELYKIIGDNFKPSYGKHKVYNSDIKLPDEFLSMSIPTKSLFYRHAFKYLIKRNVTRDDILRYNIGYCETGRYKNRIIIPSYDKDGNLNFFTARDFLNSSNLKYMTPDWSKDFVGFELFINWNEPITLTESPFNAITIRNNAIPLFGKIIPPLLKKNIVDYKVKQINLCLDKDAETDSFKIYEELKSITNNQIRIFFVQLTKKDPNEIGFEEMVKLIKNAKEIDFSFFYEKKLGFI